MKYLNYFLGIFILTLLVGCADKEFNLEHGHEHDHLVQTEVRQTRINFEPAPCSRVSDLKIFISGDCGFEWRVGSLRAMEAYNETDTGINMTTTSDSTEADITIQCRDFANGGIFGAAEVPHADGMVGAESYLNTDWEIWCSDPCFFQSVVMHELGHNLGFYHNDNICGQNGSVGDISIDANGDIDFGNTLAEIVHIPGTAPEGDDDPFSIFNSTTSCGSPFCEFNANDIIALETMFPRPDDPCQCPLAFSEDELATADCFDDPDEPQPCGEPIPDLGFECDGNLLCLTIDGVDIRNEWNPIWEICEIGGNGSSGACYDISDLPEGSGSLPVTICERESVGCETGDCCITLNVPVVDCQTDCPPPPFELQWCCESDGSLACLCAVGENGLIFSVNDLPDFYWISDKNIAGNCILPTGLPGDGEPVTVTVNNGDNTCSHTITLEVPDCLGF